MKKLISAMKLTKDLMDSPLTNAAIDKYVQAYKDMGATNVDISTVMGHPNFVSYTVSWLNSVHNAGLNATLRCAHREMEGLYGATKAVGALRKPTQYWIDEAVKNLNSLLQWLKQGDEWAIYPERTEGIFQDATSFLPQTGLPQSYADFFNSLHDACRVVAPGLTYNLTANNASELISQWMPKSLVAPATVIDLYDDDHPDIYENHVRTIFSNYGKQVYVQEGAVSRFTAPSIGPATAYYAANHRLADDGVLYGYGAWGGWSGAPESLINVDFTLTPAGTALKEWWAYPQTAPIINIDLALKSMEILRQASIIVFGTGTVTTKVNALKTLLAPQIT